MTEFSDARSDGNVLKRSSGWAKPRGKRGCTAINKRGGLCGAQALTGKPYCSVHQPGGPKLSMRERGRRGGMALRIDVSRYRGMLVEHAVTDRLFQVAMSEKTPPAVAARIGLALFDRLVPESRGAP